MKHFASILIALFVSLFGSTALAADQTVTIPTAETGMAYQKTTIQAKTGSTLSIKLENQSKGMKHNLAVIDKDASVEAVAKKGMKAGPSNDYIPDHGGVLAATSIVAPGKSTTLTLDVPEEPGTYTYVCLFPGHYQSMKGTLEVNE